MNELPKLSFAAPFNDANLKDSLLATSAHDSLVFVMDGSSDEIAQLSFFSLISYQSSIDKSFYSKVSLIATPKESISHGRLIVAPVIGVQDEYSDMRIYTNASRLGLARAIEAGSKSPLILIGIKDCNQDILLSIAHSLFQEVYVPVEVRECKGEEQMQNVSHITLSLLTSACANLSFDDSLRKILIENIESVEVGRLIARDVGGGDPERMSPINCATYLRGKLRMFDSLVVEVIEDVGQLKREYPLLHAVSRASLHVERHRPCVVKINYVPSNGKFTKRVFIVGKGITYDTGGADLKVDGCMVGMSRDKCGAAAIAGFMAVVGKRSPSNVAFSASLAFVRNSIGSDSYVSDEIIVARSGCRIRVGNTDAEGRMVMADLIAEAKEIAVEEKERAKNDLIENLIFTCATLTGHVRRAYGPSAAIVPNSCALRNRLPFFLQQCGEITGEFYEISRLRKEDFEFINGVPTNVDVVSANNKPSTLTERGHQYPAAFLLVASGLIQTKDIAFMHVDIAAVAEEKQLGKPTAFPILSFVNFLLK